MSDVDPIDLAITHHRAGRLTEAADLYRSILRTQPDHVDALHLLGVIAYQRGDKASALDLLGRAVDLGVRHADPHHHLGLVRQDLGDLQGAAVSFRRAAELDPGSARSLRRLAEVLLALGQARDAIVPFRDALVLAPEDAALHGGLGDAWHMLGELAQAVAVYQRAVALDAKNVKACWGLACALTAQGEHAAAATCLQRLVQLAPDSGEAHHNLGKALFELGQIDAALEAFAKAAALLGPAGPTLGMIAIVIPGSPGADNRAILEARRAWEAHGAPARPSRTAQRSPVSGPRRLRVGYVSAFFQDRNWMKPVWGLVKHHDRERFDIHLFSDASESSVRHGYEKHPRDRFHDISRLGNDDVARLIEEQEIDILVDLNGYSRLSRLALFALRPAPIAVTWFNMFATSGMSCFDYLIGDGHVIPAAEEEFYSERIVRVPGCYLTFEVTYPVPEVAPAPCLSRGHLTFGCLAPLYKITPQVVDAWAQILHGSAGSKLILKNVALGSAQNRRFVLDLFGRFAVAPERLELEGPAEHFAFLGKYAEMDIALDTFPYNGGTTTMEALWQGVPVLSFTGDRWASRISTSLLCNARLPEFVLAGLDSYVGRAVALANSPDTPALLDDLRRSMRDKLRQAPVCNIRAFANDMERVYERLWESRRATAVPNC